MCREQGELAAATARSCNQSLSCKLAAAALLGWPALHVPGASATSVCCLSCVFTAACKLPACSLAATAAAWRCRYGTRAVEQLQRYYQGQIADVMSEDEEAQRGAGAGNRSSNGPAAAAQGAQRR
jgi:hypothetical protein